MSAPTEAKRSRRATISAADLVAGVAAMEAARERAYDRLGDANRRGLTGLDVEDFSEAMRRARAHELELIAATGRKGVRHLLLVRHGGRVIVDAAYGDGRFREVASMPDVAA